MTLGGACSAGALTRSGSCGARRMQRASKTGVMSGTSKIARGGTENNTKRLNEGANINRSLQATHRVEPSEAQKRTGQPPTR